MEKQLQEEITLLREQLKNEDKIIYSLLQQSAKRDNIVVECNHVSIHENSDKMHWSLLSNHKEVQKNTIHEELVLDTSIIVDETINMNAETQNYNLKAKTGNGNMHQPSRKKVQIRKKIKNQAKNRKKVVLFSCHIRWQHGKHLNGWEI